MSQNNRSWVEGISELDELDETLRRADAESRSEDSLREVSDHLDGETRILDGPLESLYRVWDEQGRRFRQERHRTNARRFVRREKLLAKEADAEAALGIIRGFQEQIDQLDQSEAGREAYPYLVVIFHECIEQSAPRRQRNLLKSVATEAGLLAASWEEIDGES